MSEFAVNPYFPRIDATPFGIDASVSEAIIEQQLSLLSERIGREIHAARSTPDIHSFGDASEFTQNELLIAKNINSITLSRRRVVDHVGSTGLKGLCVWGEEGLRAGTSIWINLPPDGIRYEYELDSTGTVLGHELLHSVGVEHCKSPKCLMFGTQDTYGLEELAKRPNSFCIDHRSVLKHIARDKNYFRKESAT